LPQIRHDPTAEGLRRDAVTSPLYLAGKAMNAFFFDRIDADLARLSQINDILRAGCQRFGPAFQADLNDELARLGSGPLRSVQAVRIDPSRPLGTLAVEHVASRAFARRARGPIGQLLRCLADRDPTHSGDLLSYILFDGAFAAELIELGRGDAAAHHDELCDLFTLETGSDFAQDVRPFGVQAPEMRPSRPVPE
jgi:NTE family protein